MKTLVHCAGVINPLDPSFGEKSTIGIDEGKIVEIIPGHLEAGEGQEVISWGSTSSSPVFSTATST